MTDSELLELAAKAAGIDAAWHNEGDIDYDAAHEGLWLKGARSPDNSKYWNPLTDDGDALRLAVKLGLTINPYQEGVFVSRFEGEEVVGEPFKVMGQPDAAATRRAIVRAAAEIGKAMP